MIFPNHQLVEPDLQLFENWTNVQKKNGWYDYQGPIKARMIWLPGTRQRCPIQYWPPGSAAMALDPIHNHGQGPYTLLASVQVIVKDNSKVYNTLYSVILAKYI